MVIDITAAQPYKASTLHDVARVAGVSLITASRALSNPGVVSQKTIERVQAAVIATGYIPNLMAGSLKSKRSHLIAAVMPAIAVAQFLPTVQTMTRELAAAGFQLILGQTEYDSEREETVLNTMIGRQPDGIVMTGLVQSQKARERLGRLGIPVVETWDLSERPVDMLVGFSHMKVGSAVGGYFLKKGWNRIGIASGNDPRARMRRDGFQTTLGREVPTAYVPAPSSLELGRRALSELLSETPEIEAVYCSSDQLAHGVMVEALARGLRVPEDLAICGFGNADFSAHTQPTLTTVHVDGAEIGRRAAQMVIDRCRGETIERRIIDVGFHIIERQSTAG